jgi:hypothetical protein
MAGKIPKKKPSAQDRKAFALWAADCAEHVLHYFEKERPKDSRPKKAIEECRKWARTGAFHMADVRGYSLAAHAAARETEEKSAARFAARSAGQAMAAAHVAGHAIAAAYYAVKAAEAAGDANEWGWQKKRMPKSLRGKWESQRKKLPKRLRGIMRLK